MGWKLARNVLDNMPPDIPSGERCVVSAVAWSVRDVTGEGWATDETLCRRSGLATSGVRKALQRLASRGYELRVSTGKGKDGRLVYSHRGSAPTYRVPDAWRRGKAGPRSDLDGSKGRTPVPKGGTTVPKGGTTVRPMKSGGQEVNPRARARDDEAVGFLAEFYSCRDDEARKAYEAITEGRSVSSPLAYVRRVVEADPERWRPASSTVEATYDPDCSRCFEGFITTRDATGFPVEVHRCRCAGGEA